MRDTFLLFILEVLKYLNTSHQSRQAYPTHDFDICQLLTYILYSSKISKTLLRYLLARSFSPCHTSDDSL